MMTRVTGNYKRLWMMSRETGNYRRTVDDV
jgi:hypothetical protein